MSDKYVLDESGNAVHEPDLMKWARWFEGAGARSLEKTKIGEAVVSTVFLGIDHSFTGGAPVLWETMVFGGPLDGEQDRYTSREEAKKGHERMCARVTPPQGGINKGEGE